MILTLTCNMRSCRVAGIIFPKTSFKITNRKPDGDDIPNKKYYDPTVWLRKSDEAFVNRLEKAFRDLNNINTL